MKIFKTRNFLAEFLSKHQQEKILDLGCGNRKIAGAIGVDCIDYPVVDVAHNLNLFPYPFEGASFDAVVLNHVIEHLENIPNTLKEIHRLLKSEGEVWIATPHFSDSHSWVDHTHRHHLSIRSFINFCHPPYYWFDMDFAYITLKGRWKGIGYERLINRRKQGVNEVSRRVERWEDKHCFVRRGGEMYFILRKVKNIKDQQGMVLKY